MYNIYLQSTKGGHEGKLMAGKKKKSQDKIEKPATKIWKKKHLKKQ